MFPLRERLKEILINDKIITQEDLDLALKEQKEKGGELSKILVQKGLISEDDLTLLLSQGLGMPPIDITRLKIDPAVVKMIPKDVARNYKIIPVSRIGDSLTLAMADPLNIFAIDNVKALTGLEINPIIGRSKDILQAIDACYEEDAHLKFKEIMQDISDTEGLELVKEGEGAEEVDVEDLSQEAPIIKLTDAIIRQAVTAKASDIFIEPMEKTVRIRYRVDGLIREVDRMSKTILFPVVSRVKIISNLDISEHRLPQDGRFKIVLEGGQEVDMRVSILPTIFGEKVVMRVLDKTQAMLDVDKLGFNDQAMNTMKEASCKPHGMVLSCGPTGCGKTTTLYSLLQYIDSPEKNIVTVEDPVEYQLKGINQVNVKADAGLTFGASLRSILRQDPDIILIGEIRDFETLDIAVKSALTGHLVLSSLHTTTAGGSVIRMMNMGIEPFLICSSVLAITAQRLLRKLCHHCRQTYAVSEQLSQKVGLSRVVSQKNLELFRAKGCKRCFNTGYSGRVGIAETLVLSQAVKKVIMNRSGELKIKEAGRAEGMVTMREDGLMKACAGLTSLEEVLRTTTPDEIKK